MGYFSTKPFDEYRVIKYPVLSKIQPGKVLEHPTGPDHEPHNGGATMADTTLSKARVPGKRAPRRPHPAYVLSDRLMTIYETPRPQLNDPDRVYSLLADLKEENREMMVVFCLNTKNGAMLREIIHIGLVDQCRVSAREILKPAVLNSASSIILAHNHPSGEPQPSEEDIVATQMMAQACALFDIRLLDHVIFARDRYFSMSTAGIMPKGRA